MAQFVTLDQVKSALRVDGDDYDPTIVFQISAASAMVANYLKSSADGYIGDDGEVPDGVTIPWEVQAAVIYLVGVLIRNPDNDTESAFERGYLPMPVTAMLYPLRDPACA